MALFHNRTEAGRELARRLEMYQEEPNVLVLGTAPNGMAVAYEVAQTLRLPLDVFVIRKLEIFSDKGLMIGAVTSGGERVLFHDRLRDLNISEHALQVAISREQQEIERLEAVYRGPLLPKNPNGKTVLLVDDGGTTAESLWAAARALRRMGAGKVVAALPFAPEVAQEVYREEVDDLITLSSHQPEPEAEFAYHDSARVSDQQVHDLLAQNGR